jgi:UDP-N-acetylmuramoyl-tripeptide--D-alanyl-D-alanine ligase
VLRYSLSPGADVYAQAITPAGLTGSEFIAVTPAGRAPVRLAIPGGHAVSNALAAIAAGHVLGIGVEAAAAALASVRPLEGRLTLKRTADGAMLIDDCYNASPTSVEAAIAVLMASPTGPRVAVLGDMLELGDETAAAHRRIGRAAAGLDLLIAVGEHAGDIVAGAVQVGMAPDRAWRAEDREEAAAMAAETLAATPGAGAVLVKASRGAALERVVELLEGAA